MHLRLAAKEHTSPSASPLTSCEILLSQNARLQIKDRNIFNKTNYIDQKNINLAS